MADLLTIREHRGELRGQRVAYIGDGNNTAASLAIACASVGADFVIAAPADYQIPTPAWREATRRALASQSKVGWVELPQQAARDADVVYTDTWVSMGQDDEAAVRLEAFKDYQVNEELMSYAKPDALFMHDLPAYEGKEVAPGMIDHPRSVVFDQAENRLHAQKAILAGVVS
jgi:ornithine carbamoyltransferase